MKDSWPPKCCTEIIIETVSTPEGPAATLYINVIETIGSVCITREMKADGQSKASSSTKQAPTMVDPRLREEPQALAEASLDTNETYGAPFFRQKVISC